MSTTTKAGAPLYDNALHMMELQGGSFVKALAHCYYMADFENRAKLRTAFADYFDTYEARFKAYRAAAAQEQAS